VTISENQWLKKLQLNHINTKTINHKTHRTHRKRTQTTDWH